MTTRTSIGPTTGCPGRESERHDSAVAVESPQGSSVPASLGNLRDGRECLRSRGIAARHPGCLIILLTQRRMTRQLPVSRPVSAATRLDLARDSHVDCFSVQDTRLCEKRIL